MLVTEWSHPGRGDRAAVGGGGVRVREGSSAAGEWSPSRMRTGLAGGPQGIQRSFSKMPCRTQEWRGPPDDSGTQGTRYRQGEPQVEASGLLLPNYDLRQVTSFLDPISSHNLYKAASTAPQSTRHLVQVSNHSLYTDFSSFFWGLSAPALTEGPSVLL